MHHKLTTGERMLVRSMAKVAASLASEVCPSVLNALLAGSDV
eukprot:CAMPEP_0175620942 /NCGR_PEP_ID=MMETSP0096-20121207/68175_1 /TAXON_ID=311494 /ORGANISM="Alexandrium monilatum, Strain CCMP3105" /LENGTH=41 /DNA_ID= /DNA_START= /DNA_END= /DNA_ORIENTATION=